MPVNEAQVGGKKSNAGRKKNGVQEAKQAADVEAEAIDGMRPTYGPGGPKKKKHKRSSTPQVSGSGCQYFGCKIAYDFGNGHADRQHKDGIWVGKVTDAYRLDGQLVFKVWYSDDGDHQRLSEAEVKQGMTLYKKSGFA